MGTTTSTLRIRVRLQPRAAHTRIVGGHGDAIKIQVHAPPVDGAANAALVELLATVLEVPRRAIRIAQGTSNRDKVVELLVSDPKACQLRLHALLRGRVDKPGAGD